MGQIPGHLIILAEASGGNTPGTANIEDSRRILAKDILNLFLEYSLVLFGTSLNIALTIIPRKVIHERYPKRLYSLRFGLADFPDTGVRSCRLPATPTG